MDPFIKAQLLKIMAPACICAVIVVLCSYFWHKNSKKENYWSIAFGLAVGFAFAHWATVGEIPSFPIDVDEYDEFSWLIYISGVVAIYSLFNYFVTHWATKIIGIIIFASISACLIIPSYVSEDYGVAVFWMWRLAYVAVAVLWFYSLEEIINVASDWTSIFCFLFATGTSGVLVLFGSAKLGELCGAIAAMSMAMFVISFLFPKLSWRHNGTYFISLVVPALLLNGYFAGEELSYWPMIFIALAPTFIFFTKFKFFQGLNVIIKLVFPIVSIAIALIIAYTSY